jgi:hypothetical protein
MKHGLLTLVAGFAVLAAGCASEPPIGTPPAGAPRAGTPRAGAPANRSDSRALIDRSLPRGVGDRAGWIADMLAAFGALDIAPTPENVCAVVAVTEQESGFQVDPVIPDLGAIARREIDSRAERAGVPASVVHEVLKLRSPDGRTYGERIDRARTERELSEIFEDFTGSIPLGRSLFASWNPIRTRGPMQVNVAFAEAFAATHPYPYPIKVSLADEVFTRRGSLYFGTAHLLAYSARYDRTLYRFADFNAGQYSSRNAAFQLAVSRASGIPIAPDGALLPREERTGAGETELAVRTMGQRLHMGDEAIHDALEQGRTQGFERTPLYQAVFDLAEQAAARPLPRASIPRIQLQGPKITRHLTTEWYARRVDDRFKRCLAR